MNQKRGFDIGITNHIKVYTYLEQNKAMSESAQSIWYSAAAKKK